LTTIVLASAPIYLAGGLKLIQDIAFCCGFGHVIPPEEAQ